MVIGYGVRVRLFKKVLCTKYYLKYEDTVRGVCPLWNYEKIPFVSVGAFCIQDSDFARYPDEVKAVLDLAKV